MANLILVAPIDGWSSPLDEVPDPVFAGKVMGDGLAIDPTSATLRAPCDGEVIALHAAKHAITLRAKSGAEVLMHIGCDTVALGGDGFEAHVSQGQTVRTGDALVTFALDRVALKVPSLMTPVVVLNDTFEVVRRAEQQQVRTGDFLLELRPVAAAASPNVRGAELARIVRVPYEHGIHARPAAVLANALHKFSADVTASTRGRTVNARSAVAWMQLAAQRGDEIALKAIGPDAEAALQALLVHFGETPLRPQKDVVRAVIASRGIAIGPAARIDPGVPELQQDGAGVAHENAALDRARDVVRTRLETLRANANGLAREVLSAHLSFIDDEQLIREASQLIDRGRSAGYAWREAMDRTASALANTADPRIAERGADLRDLAAQVLRALAGASPVLDPPAGSILIGQELLPSQLVALPPGRIAGFCTAAGGPTSHVALLAASMNLPALVAAGREVLEIAEGTPLIVDAEEGVLRINPDRATVDKAANVAAQRVSRRETAKAMAGEECHLASGERIEVFANIGAVTDVTTALASGAEGCGLLRTEFLFLDRNTPPDVAFQTAAYQSIVSEFAGRPVVIRTLDAGSDKPLQYLPLPRSENPALGVRGVRASLRHPELLREQLRSILRVEPLTACRILVPMINDASEVDEVRQILNAECRHLGVAAPPLGVMIETPASALNAANLAAGADFFSIGTNDLAQYTLAMDRGEAELAAQLDARHPAVLRLIQMTATAARAAGKRVAVCGGLASDPDAAAVLVGLGVNELSAIPSVIPEVKARLRALRLEDCRALAERALARGDR
jgi:phosphoenolpyruvate-protein phosphotransferase